MSRQTRIAALRRLAAPDSGATDNERVVALDKLALLEGKQPQMRVDPTFDPYKQYVVGWDVATGPDQHVNCRCTMPDMEGAAWPEAEAWFRQAMQQVVYDAFTTGGSINDIYDATRRGMENDHGE